MKKGIILLLCFCSLNVLFADNTGILKSRLIELSEGDYLLEAEVPVLQETAIGDPVFPDRFLLNGKGRSEFQGMVTMSFHYSSLSEGLNEKDVLIFPWIINGTSLTVFRSDGAMKQRLYLRTLDGIRIPLEHYFYTERTKGEIVSVWLKELIGKSELLIPFILLALILASFGSLQTAGSFSIVFFAAQSLGMVAGELGLSGPDLLYGQLLVLGVSFFLAAKNEIPKLNTIIAPGAAAGFILGFGLYREISFLPYSTDILLILHLLTIVYWNLIFIFLTVVLILTASVLVEMNQIKWVLKYICAVFALFFILLLFQERVITGDRDVLTLSARQNSSRFDLPDPKVLQNNQGVAIQPLGIPAQAYMSVDPFELRIEVLLRLDDLMNSLDLDGEYLKVQDQYDFLKTLEDDFISSLQVRADGVLTNHIESRVDFVTLGSGGVSIRSSAVDENRTDGLIGLTLIYGTTELLGEVDILWDFFPSGIETMPGRATQLWGTEDVIINRNDNHWNWKNPVKRTLFPKIEEISVESSGFPLPTIVLLLTMLLVILIQRSVSGKLLLSLLLLFSILCYPFIRIPVPGAWVPVQKDQITAAAEALLSNLYRSFDVQEDSDVYDRLSLSVSGDLLQDVFLQNRKAMVLENKGGARARMDNLELISMDNLRKEKNGFQADIEWTVSGSVSHFGHTHYRKNRYLADITFSIVDDKWKITEIEMLREEREF